MAALFVFFDHLPATRAFSERYSLGPLAVAFFFLLSGFILMLNYREHFVRGVTWNSTRLFYLARLGRVYPLHLVTTVTAIVAIIAYGESPHNEYGNIWLGLSAGDHAIKIAAAVLLFQPWAYSPLVILGVNPPAWSIADEAFFYTMFPILAWYASRVCRPFNSVVVLSFAAFFCVFTGIVLCLGSAVPWIIAYYFPPLRIFEFFVGILLALAFVKRAGNEVRFGTSLEMIAVVVFVCSVAVLPLVPRALRYAVWMMPASSLIISIFAHRAGALSRWLSQSTFVLLGEISFAFYLLHAIVIGAISSVFGDGLPQSVFSFVVTLAASYALYRCVEVPARRWIRGRGSNGARVAGPAFEFVRSSMIGRQRSAEPESRSGIGPVRTG